MEQLHWNLRREIQAVCVAVHCEGVHRAPQPRVDISKQNPNHVVHGASGIRALRADDGILRVPVVEEIPGGKDVRALALGRSLPIGGKPCEKVVVKGITLRTREEIVKERRGVLIIVPEYREIVLHFSLSPHMDYAFSASSNTRKKP